MPVIGITGSIGSGKSTVASLFHKHGACVFDADKAVSQLLNHPSVVKKISKSFGTQAVVNNLVNRSLLADIVFNDPDQLQTLTDIMHPLVKKQAREFIALHKNRLVVLDIPLLIESGWHTMVDAVIVVKAPLKDQFSRLKTKGFSRRQVLNRLRCQMPVKDKLKFADHVINNNGSKADTYIQVKRVIDLLKKESVHNSK